MSGKKLKAEACIKARGWQEALELLLADGYDVVRAAVLELQYTGPLYDLVYFKDADGDEIGYYCSATKTLRIFKTRRKVAPVIASGEKTIWEKS